MGRFMRKIIAEQSIKIALTNYQRSHADNFNNTKCSFSIKAFVLRMLKLPKC